MTPFHTLDDRLQVAGQIALEDVARAAQAGVTLVINDRPDGEDPAAPDGAAIAAACAAARVGYRAIPVGHGGFGRGQVEAMADALEQADGKILAYCRSGTRSTFLWALARASRGAPAATLAAAAHRAGYDLAPVATLLTMLGGATSDGQR